MKTILYVRTKSPSGFATHTIACPPTTLCQTIATVWKALIFQQNGKAFLSCSKWNCPVTKYWYKSEFRWGKEKKNIRKQAIFFPHKPNGWYTKHRNIIVTSNLVGCFPLVLCRHSSGSISDTLDTLKSLICIVLHFHFQSLSLLQVVWYGTTLRGEKCIWEIAET